MRATAHPSKFLLTLCGLIALSAAPVQQALGNGDFDEAELADFQHHLDQYRTDVEGLIADLEPIVSGYAAGKDVTSNTAALIEHWEGVHIHGAIERKATLAYPGVWMAVIALQQAVAGGKPVDQISDAAEEVKAALWQGLGAVRMAASLADGEAPAQTTEAEPMSSAETVAQIVADLDAAVAAYQADKLRDAQALIHETYMTRFEGLEGDLIARAPELVSSLERDFNATLPLLMQQGASLDEVNDALQAMKDQLENAGDILQQVEQDRSEVF